MSIPAPPPISTQTPAITLPPPLYYACLVCNVFFTSYERAHAHHTTGSLHANRTGAIPVLILANDKLTTALSPQQQAPRIGGQRGPATLIVEDSDDEEVEVEREMQYENNVPPKKQPTTDYGGLPANMLTTPAESSDRNNMIKTYNDHRHIQIQQYIGGPKEQETPPPRTNSSARPDLSMSVTIYNPSHFTLSAAAKTSFGRGPYVFNYTLPSSLTLSDRAFLRGLASGFASTWTRGGAVPTLEWEEMSVMGFRLIVHKSDGKRVGINVTAGPGKVGAILQEAEPTRRHTILLGERN